MDRVSIKKKAKEFAYNNKWNVWKAILLVSVFSSIGSSLVGILSGGNQNSVSYSLLSTVVQFALLPMQVGMMSYMLKLVRGKNVDVVDELFSKYKGEYFWKIIAINLIAGLIILGFSFLFVIPGIIYAIKYAMITFILAEQTSKEMEEEKAYKISEKLMDGHKWEYLVFQLSFVGWVILGIFTFGILFIWIVPYISVANAMWYEKLKEINKPKEPKIVQETKPIKPAEKVSKPKKVVEEKVTKKVTPVVKKEATVKTTKTVKAKPTKTTKTEAKKTSTTKPKTTTRKTTKTKKENA